MMKYYVYQTEEQASASETEISKIMQLGGEGCMTLRWSTILKTKDGRFAIISPDGGGEELQDSDFIPSEDRSWQ